MAQAVVRVRGADLVWSMLGTEQGRGRWVENLQLTSDQHGPLRCTFTLHRDPHLPWPELVAFAPVDVEVDGVVVWTGRIAQSPFTLGGADQAINVECEGIQAVLDDDMDWRTYVIGNLGAFQDQRQMPWVPVAGNYGGWPSYFAPGLGAVNNGNGFLELAFTRNQALALGQCVGALIDLGPAANLKAVSLILSTTATAGYTLFVRGQTVPDFTYNVGYVDFIAGGVALNLITGGANTRLIRGPYTTATAGLRYLFVVLYSQAAQTPAVDVSVRIHQVQVASSAGYLPASGLTDPLVTTLYASNVILDWLGIVSQISSDRSRIAATSLAIPEYVPQTQSAREGIEAMNAYHDYLWGVDEQRVPYFQPRPTTAIYECGDWAGWTFTDASSGSAEDIYNWAGVQGVGQDGLPFISWATRPTPALDRYGYARTKLLSVQSQITPAVAASMAATYLANIAATPFKGSINVQGQGGVRTVLGGQKMHPSQLLPECGQLIRLPLVDPNTGGWGRDVMIAGVSYTHDTESADITLDTDNSRFQSLLEQMGLATTGIGAGG